MPYIITLWGKTHDIKTCETLEEAQAYVAESNARQGRPVDDTLSIVEIDEIRPCVFCGSHVTAKNWPETDFCRGCYHSGRADEREHGDLLASLESLPNVKDGSVGIWNSGGGCMILSFNLTDGRYASATACYQHDDGSWHIDGGLPDGPDPRWGFYLLDSDELEDDDPAWSDPSRLFEGMTPDEFVSTVAELEAVTA